MLGYLKRLYISEMISLSIGLQDLVVPDGHPSSSQADITTSVILQETELSISFTSNQDLLL